MVNEPQRGDSFFNSGGLGVDSNLPSFHCMTNVDWKAGKDGKDRKIIPQPTPWQSPHSTVDWEETRVYFWGSQTKKVDISW